MLSPVLLDRTGGVVVITLNRPASLNAMSDEAMHALERVLDELASDATVRAAIITGAARHSRPAETSANSADCSTEIRNRCLPRSNTTSGSSAKWSGCLFPSWRQSTASRWREDWS
jgi:1,4-dihydroxy-2-naphthoyl-CoA synthase